MGMQTKVRNVNGRDMQDEATLHTMRRKNEKECTIYKQAQYLKE